MIGRRAFLLATTGALAGCAGVPLVSDSDDGLTVTADASSGGDGYEVHADASGSHEDDVVATVAIEIENVGTEPIGIVTGPPAPFGVLLADAENADRSLLLWSSQYQESNHVGTENHRITFRTLQKVVTRLQPGETVEETYSLRHDASIDDVTNEVEAGTYRLRGPRANRSGSAASRRRST